ncbi:MAG: hypothetical protein JNK05_28990 [Myxococcales bacterium]|nr:hypothetical protein [Myxococcales bacterium]
MIRWFVLVALGACAPSPRRVATHVRRPPSIADASVVAARPIVAPVNQDRDGRLRGPDSRHRFGLNCDPADPLAHLRCPSGSGIALRTPPRWWAPRCAVTLEPPLVRTTAWRPSVTSVFTHTQSWLATVALIANDGLEYVDATVETFERGAERTRGWRLDSQVFASRSALLTWAGVVLPIRSVHGAARLHDDVAPVLAGRDHPGFDGSRWLAPSPYSSVTASLMLRAGVLRQHETPLLDQHRRAVAFARRARDAPAAASSIEAWAKTFDGFALGARLRRFAVYAHAAGDHEAAVFYLRSLHAICVELAPMRLPVGYGLSVESMCDQVEWLLRDNEERTRCPPRSLPLLASERAIEALADTNWSAIMGHNGPSNPVLSAAVLDPFAESAGLSLLALAYASDERPSRTVFEEIGSSHPPPPSILPAHRLAHAALVRRTGTDCETSVERPTGMGHQSAAHRQFCVSRMRLDDARSAGP